MKFSEERKECRFCPLHVDDLVLRGKSEQDLKSDDSTFRCSMQD